MSNYRKAWVQHEDLKAQLCEATRKIAQLLFPGSRAVDKCGYFHIVRPDGGFIAGGIDEEDAWKSCAALADSWVDSWQVQGGWIARGDEVFHVYPMDSKESADKFAAKWVAAAAGSTDLSRRWAEVVRTSKRSFVMARHETVAVENRNPEEVAE